MTTTAVAAEIQPKLQAARLKGHPRGCMQFLVERTLPAVAWMTPSQVVPNNFGQPEVHCCYQRDCLEDAQDHHRYINPTAVALYQQKDCLQDALIAPD